MPNEVYFSREQVRRYITYTPVSHKINMVGIHHTWSPNAGQYKGLSTIQGIRRYHVEVRKFVDNGYHFLVAPNGDLWRCRPMPQVGAHIAGHNSHSVGVGFIANFDVEDPIRYGGMENGLILLQMLLKRFGLATDAVHFHREYANKTCPGTKIDRKEFHHWIDAGSFMPAMKVIWLPTGAVVPCGPVLKSDATWVDAEQFCAALHSGQAPAGYAGSVLLRSIAEACGFEVIWHAQQPQKVYLRPALL